jgi:hypothetical protein
VSRQGGDGRRRTLLIAAAIAVAALLGLVVCVAPRSSAPPEPVAQVVPKPPPPARPTDRSPGGATNGGPSGAGDASAFTAFDPHDMPVIPPPGPSARFPYPPGSQAVTEGFNPATQPQEDDPVDAEKGIHCIFGPRVAVVHPPDPLVIDLEVKNNLGADLPISDGVARFRTEQGDPKKGPWITTPFVDDGSGRDLAGGDHKYTATLVPTDDQRTTLLAGGVHLYVEVDFQAPHGLGARDYVTTMQYSRKPDGTLNGKYAESVDQGSLVISVGVTTTVAAEYRVIGTLYGGEAAITFASKSAQLGVGEGTIPLLFFGKILHDRGIDGPYVLRYAMLYEHLGRDDIPGDTVDPAYTTQPYRARSFSDAPYVPAAPTFEVVDQNSPSQQGKPPPLFTDNDRQNLRGPTAPIKPDPPNAPAQPVPTGTK